MGHLTEYACKRLNRAQYGFCPGVGIEDCKHEVFQHALRLKKDHPDREYCALFVDFSSAYDRVDRNHLYAFLESRRILPPHVLQLLKFLHSRLSFSLNGISCRSTNGVPQGMTSSPMLFDIFTESLLELFQSSSIDDVFLRLFADDLVLFCPRSALDKCIDLLERWSDSANMRINKKKSAVMLLNENGRGIPAAIRSYTIVQHYKYLGTIFTPQLSVLPHLKVTTRKANFLTFKLRPVLLRGHFRLNCNLFQLFVLPSYRLLLSLLPLIHPNQLRLVEKELRQAFRKFCRLPQSCPNEFVAAIIGTLEKKSIALERISTIKIAARNEGRALKKE